MTNRKTRSQSSPRKTNAVVKESLTAVDRANRYIKGVLDGSVDACKWVKLACQRQIDDLKNQKKYYFDVDKANFACRFIESLPHIKGSQFAGKNMILGDWQCFIITTVFGWLSVETGLRRFNTVYIECPRKNGKALALNTLIPTPYGWSTMESIKVGDIVFDENGRQCNVTAVTDVMHDRDCYRIIFSNGQEVIADADHEWITKARVDTIGGKSRAGIKNGTSIMKRVRTTREISESVRYGARNDVNHSIDMPKQLEIEAIDLPIEPYTLGAWLGDGHSMSGRITFARDDVEILDGIKSDGFPVREMQISTGKASTYAISDGNRSLEARKKSFTSKLRLLNLLNNKHIPNVYLRASFEQRLALLQGLMDTDGTADKMGRSQSFTNKNKRLIDGVCELFATLGIKYKLSSKYPKCNGIKLNELAYTVQFHCFSDVIQLFRLNRKLNRQKVSCSTKSRSQTVQIVSCEKVKSVPVKCIEVDSPSHLYRFGETMLPTHNSTLSAPVALYLLAADKEPGAEVYSAATGRDQAKIVWEDAKRMVDRSQALREALGVETSAHSVFIRSTASSFKALSRDQQGNLDGLNIHGAIVDELHGHKDRGVWDVIETATGARAQPLVWAITTAGSNRAGICYEQQAYVRKILDGVHEDDTYFGIIYTIDANDDPFDPKTWAKANPNYGISVSPEDLARKASKAQQMAAAQNNFLTKHLNVWVNADTAWMNMQAWDKCADESLDERDFEGQDCVISCDLATKVDIAAKIKLFWKDIDGKRHYYAFGKYYLPEDAAEDGRNSQYSGWAIENRLVLTDGNVTDFSIIEDQIREDARRYNVIASAFDPWQASALIQRLQYDGMQVTEYRQTVQNLSEPMKELEALVLQGRFHFDGDPVLTWMISNVVAHLDAKENIYPRKERPENKIDGAVALICALGMCITLEDDDSAEFNSFVKGPIIV